MATISMVTLLLTVTLAFATESGVKIGITTKGVDYVNRIAAAALRNKLQTLTLADQSGNEGRRTTWSVTNIRVNSVTGPDTQISLNPEAGGVTLGVSNFGIDLSADWRAKYRRVVRISSHGSVDLSVAGASVTVVARLGENNGRPSVIANSCSCRINDIGIRFHRGLAAFVLNLLRGAVRGRIRNLLQDKVCEIVLREVNTRADEELSRMKITVDVARRFLLDYSLTRAPTVTGNYIEVASRGAFYWKDNRQESPFTPASLPALSDPSSMVYLWITEYTANTFAYKAHANGYLKHNITLANIPADSLHLLDPTPQLQSQYPDSKLELRVSSSSAPSVKFEYLKLTIAAAANVEVVVHTHNGTVSPLVLNVNVSLTVQPSVTDEKLTATIVGYTFNISVIHTSIGDIHEEELNTLIRENIDEVVLPELNEIGSQGIDLPVTGIFQLYNTRLDLQTGYLLVSTDVQYIEETAQASP